MSEVLKRYQVFKGSNKAITPNTLLWRYMTFEKFCWLLETSKLYHTRLDQFHDPFEGAVTNAYARMRDAGEMKPHFGLKEHEPWTFKSLRLRQFATCWHASENESDALWQIYASGGSGVAIISTIERIKLSVNLSPYAYGILGEVEYVNFETHDMWRDRSPTVIRPGHLKRKIFEHEREVRGIVTTNFIVEGSSFTMDESFLEKQRNEQPKGIAPDVDLKALLQSIVVSPLADGFVEELVIKTSERRGLGHLVSKSKLLGTPAY
jgi:hypothetical protein